MTITLENNKYTAVIKTHGAELISFKNKDTQIEYIWYGKPEFWGRHAPILFPYVGRLKEDQFIFEGKTYKGPQHGFARDREFELVSQSQTSARFSLKYTNETLEKYPFKFELIVGYVLSEEGIETSWTVKNLDDQRIYFGIGGHPAFNVPMEKGLTFEDYYIEFEPSGIKTRIPFVPPYLDTDHKFQEEVGKIQINRELFVGDALVYETKEPTTIHIKSNKSEHSLSLSYENIPYVGLWSTYPTESPFVCIEPWWSFADTTSDRGVLNEKTSIQSLEVGDVFETSYFIHAI